MTLAKTLAITLGISVLSLPCLAQADQSALNGNIAQGETIQQESAFDNSQADEKGLVAVNSGAAVRKMELTDEQREKIYKLKNNLIDSVGSKRLELGKEKRHLRDLLSQQTIDKSAITSTHDKINKLSAEISNARLDFQIAMAQELTPEQRQKIRYKSLGKKHHKEGKRHHKGARFTS